MKHGIRDNLCISHLAHVNHNAQDIANCAYFFLGNCRTLYPNTEHIPELVPKSPIYKPKDI